MSSLNGIEFTDWQLECCGVRERGARLLASAQWADCTFLVGLDREPANAHRVILAAASPEFQSLLYGLGKEDNAFILIPDIRPEVFQKLLIYIYSDKVDLHSYNIAFELYRAAQRYKLKHLLIECTEYLASVLAPENACRLYEFANFIGDQKLQDKSLQVILKNTKTAINSNSFNDIAVGTVIDIFAMDDLTIDSELDLLAAAERYVSEQREIKHEIEQLKIGNNADTASSGSDQEGGPVLNGDVTETSKADHLNGIIENNDEEKTQVKNEMSEPPSYQDVEKKDVNSRSEATFCYTVHNFSTLKGKVTSPTFYVRDLPWKLTVRPCYSQKQKRLAIFLHCNSDSKSVSWSCEAKAEVKVKSSHDNTELYYGRMQTLFCRRTSNRGFRYCKRLNDIVDYIKNDSITLEVYVSAEEPRGFSWNLKIDNFVDLNDVAIQAIVRHIRFLALSAKALAEYKPETPLLAEHDILGFVMNIISENTYIPLPEGFSTIRRPRKSTHAPIK